MFGGTPHEELSEYFTFFAEIYAIFNIGACVALWAVQGSFSQNFAKKERKFENSPNSTAKRTQLTTFVDEINFRGY